MKKEPLRQYPQFSLCGLNCGLCPMYNIHPENHCTGCGGAGRPSCPVIRCARNHGNVQFCFQCSDFPCSRYREQEPFDSFITTRNILSDLEKARDGGLEEYKRVLEAKMEILRYLLDTCNDGRRKSFFCLAVNLLPLEDLQDLPEKLSAKPGASLTERGAAAAELLRQQAEARGIFLKLNKKKRTDKAANDHTC